MRVVEGGALSAEIMFTTVRNKAARQSFRRWLLLVQLLPFANLLPGLMANLNLRLRRSLSLSQQRFSFGFEADCLNVANHPTLNDPSSVVGSAAFGTFTAASGNRYFQLAGGVNF